MLRALALFLLASTGYASTDTYAHINLPRKTGMFSVFSYVAAVLYQHENTPFAGLEINFMDKGAYYDPAYGPNWWQYYCEPVCLGNRENAKVKMFDEIEYVHLATFVEEHLSRYQVNDLIKKYIKIIEPIQEKIDKFVLENFEGHPIICVHYRGTDKELESPSVPYDEVKHQIKYYLKMNKLIDYKIFLATDQLEFAQFLQNAFPGSVISHSTLYSTDKKPLHLHSRYRYLQGEEALIDCVLLSKGDVLIRTSSNLSLWSTYFNPTIPQIQISTRQKKWKHLP